MKLTLPYPPSVNNLYVTVRGRRVLSTEGKRFKMVARQIANTAGVEMLQGSVQLRVWLYRPQKSGDLDNFLKATQDCLTGIAYKDDAQVIHIEAWRLDDPGNPRVEIEVVEVVV